MDDCRVKRQDVMSGSMIVVDSIQVILEVLRPMCMPVNFCYFNATTVSYAMISCT